MTKVYGILAHPAGHSLSPAMFNAAFDASGIDAEYRIFDEADLGRFLELSRDLSGLSVSLPYKEKVVEHLNFVSEDVKAIGACNTVKIEDGRLSGFNTDWVGFLEALARPVSGLRVVVLGAGGAARAIVYGLVKEGAKVVVLNRTVEKAKKLAEEFSCEGFGGLPDLSKFECDILVQATSAGVSSRSDVLVDVEYLKRVRPVVFDIVYKPLITLLLETARNVGCEIITGEKMLLNQAVKQFEIWFGREAPKEVMRGALVENLK